MSPRLSPVSLRTRTLIAFVLMVIALVAILQLLATSIIGRSYRAVEERAVGDRVEQASNALANSLATLSRVNRDYAVWDDSYAFVAGRDPAYVATNLSDETFINLGLSYLAFVNRDGELVYARAFDLATGRETPLPAALSAFDAAPNTALLQHADPQGELSGIFNLGAEAMLLTARPILTSQGEGPPAGTLLMGRKLDAYELAQIAAIARLPIALSALDDPALSPPLRAAAAPLAAGQSVVAVPLDNSRILGVSRIPALLDRPGFLLHLELDREIARLGEQARGEYILVLVGVSLLFGALGLWMLERTVLNRTLDLSVQVAAVDLDRPGDQVAVKGGDEIGQLGDAINQMLIRLAAARRHLVTSELRYRQLIELSPDAIVIHDGRRIRFTNLAGARLFGDGTPETTVGLPVAAEIAALRPRADGAPVLADRLLTLPDRSVIEAELVVLPFPEGESTATQVIVRNVSERKQAERALRAAKEAADAANRAKSQFLSTISHELRTPLTAILGFADLLGDAAAANPELLADLGRIRTAGAHLLAIVNDLLDLSQIEAGRMPVSHAPVELSLLLQTVVETVEPLAAQNNNRLVLEGDTSAGVMQTDEVRLRQILLNLLGNACKFTHAGTVSLAVKALPSPDGGGEQVCFVVADTGIGISPAQLRLLFRNFVQVDASTTRKYGGTGLGLALSRRLAHLLGGEISVVSEPGVGSTFTLALPRAGSWQPTPVSDGGLADPEGPAAEHGHAQPEWAHESRLVLVIDDDPAARALLPQVLAHPRLHVETSAGGEGGLELAAALLPDLIILAEPLAEQDRCSLLSRLRAGPETDAIPVLVRTHTMLDESLSRNVWALLGEQGEAGAIRGKDEDGAHSRR